MMFGFGKKGRLGLPTVRFDRSRVTPGIKDALLEAINDYEDLPLGEEVDIYLAALEGISRGGDLAFITRAMTDRGMPRARAAQIARDLTSRATSQMGAERTIDLGLTEARWQWSGACRLTGHQDADRKLYDPRLGLNLAGRLTFPGRDAGCSCIGNAVIPGFD